MAHDGLDVWIDRCKEDIGERNFQYVESELDKLDQYRNEVIMQLEKERDDIKRQWEEARRQQQRAKTFQERMQCREEAFQLERQYQAKANEVSERTGELFEEQQQEYNRLKAKAELQVDRSLIGIAHWVLK